MTAATQLIVIYATKSGILRRKIIPDNDEQIPLHQPGPGESRLLLPLAQPHGDSACRAAIASTTVVVPASGRCCIVDTAGNVIGICNADPALDAHSAGQLVAHDAAGPGDRHEDGIFKRRYAIVDSTSKKVTAIEYLPLGNPAAPAGSFLLPAENRRIGELVPKKGCDPASP